jgi:hypothetical protein
LAATAGRLRRGDWTMDLLQGLRAAMMAVDAYYKERGILID